MLALDHVKPASHCVPARILENLPCLVLLAARQTQGSSHFTEFESSYSFKDGPPSPSFLMIESWFANQASKVLKQDDSGAIRVGTTYGSLKNA